MRESNRPLAWVLGGSNHPDRLIISGEMLMHGVHWDVEIGLNDDSLIAQFNHTAKIRAYADGPFCPTDHCRLTALVEPTMIVGKKRIWKCAKCRAVFKRPTDVYGDEEDEVEKVAMADFEAEVKKNEKGFD